MNWVVLSLVSALALASGDAATKRFLAGYETREMAIVYAVAAGACLLPWLVTQPWPETTPAFWGWVACLMPLEILAMVLYLAAIRDCPLALTVPYLAFTPILTVVTGFVLLGETVTWQGLAGVSLVVVGAYLLNAEHRALGGWLAPLRAILREKGSRYMLLAAVIFSLTSAMGKAALAYVPTEFFAPMYYVALAIVVPVIFAFDRPARIAALWRRPLASLLIGGLGAIMIFTHFLALAEAQVAYMIAVKRSSLLFGIIYGALIFREPRLRQNLFAGALMVAGVALVAV